MACYKEPQCVAYLADKDATVVAQELLRVGLVSKEVVDHLTHFPSQVPNLMKHRYLFSEVYKTTNNDKSSFMRMIEVLLQLPSNPLPTSDNYTISSQHLPDIGEILAGYASKWRLIGTALRFQPQELDTIQYKANYFPDPAKHGLLELLGKWINREFKHTLPPTLRSLNQVLNSQLVGLGVLTEVREVIKPDLTTMAKISTTGINQCLPYVVSSVFLDVKNNLGFSIICQNINHIKAEENESFLLEVQASSDRNEMLNYLKYRWELVGSGTSLAATSFLCITADISIDGYQYVCELATKYYEERKDVSSAQSVDSENVDIALDPFPNASDQFLTDHHDFLSDDLTRYKPYEHPDLSLASDSSGFSALDLHLSEVKLPTISVGTTLIDSLPTATDHSPDLADEHNPHESYDSLKFPVEPLDPDFNGMLLSLPEQMPSDPHYIKPPSLKKEAKRLLKKLKPMTVTTKIVTVHVTSQLDTIRDGLRSIYLAQPEVPEDTWPPIGSKKFINLALIKQETANYRNKITQLTIRGDLDDILKDKEKIEYKGLISSLKAEDVLFIEGRPGSGKTTLVHRITRDWANSPANYSRTIRALFLVSLRVLNTMKKFRLTLSDILQLFNKKTEVTKNLVEKNDGKGVCFIFDGLDEFSPSDGQKSVVHRIINKDYLAKSIVIVASRPVATAHFRSKATKVVEVLGFLKDQIFEYISHYPFSKAITCLTRCEATKSEMLNRYLCSHPNILHMCYLPIHAVMMAFLFEVTGMVPRTETEIYSHFARFTVMRTVSKSTCLGTNITNIQCMGKQEQYKTICQLAFKKTILNEQVLYENEVHLLSNDKNEDATLGLLTLDHTAGLYGLTSVYTFLHLTFQEYLASCHVSSLSYEEQMKMIEEHGDKDHMLVVWKFYCGLTNFFNVGGTDNRYKAIFQMTMSKGLFQVQCAYESQLKPICNEVLESVDYHIRIQQIQYLSIPDFTAIGYVISKSVFPTKLTMERCNITADAMKALAAEIGDTENLREVKLFQCLDTMEAIEGFVVALYQCKNVKLLDISHNRINDRGAEILAGGLSYCRSLERIVIAYNYLTAAGVKSIFKSLRHCNLKVDYEHDVAHQNSSSNINDMLNALAHCNCLKSLFLKMSKTQEKPVDWTYFRNFVELHELVFTDYVMNSNLALSLAAGIEHCCQLEVLDLSNNHINDCDGHAIFESLKSPNLRYLTLRNNKLRQSSSLALAAGLSHCPNLLMLNLKNNLLIGDDITVILGSLRSLMELDISNNQIGDEGARALSLYLQQKGNLKKLYLNNNHICIDGARALAQSFTQYPHFQELDLSNNRFEVAGITLLINSIRESIDISRLTFNSCSVDSDAAEILSSHFHNYGKLHSLSLVGNNIDGSGLKVLLERLSQCSNLKTLNLSKNNLGDPGIKVVASGLAKCPGLVELHLGGNKIDSEGIKSLSLCFKHCKNLEGLNLSNNIISAVGAKALADNLFKHCLKLNWLDLSGNDFCGQVEDAIKSMCQYRKIKYSSCQSITSTDCDLQL